MTSPPSLTLVHHTVATPDGPFTILARADGTVLAASWTADVAALTPRIGRPGEITLGATLDAAAAVAAYYDGEHDAPLAVPVHSPGTPFRASVWEALRTIPAGHTRTYGELAAQLGNPSASRAVGALCGANPAALFVPCHRVVGASGALTGFAWGVDVKRSLLAREAPTP